jgi:hypothetical protein
MKVCEVMKTFLGKAGKASEHTQARLCDIVVAKTGQCFRYTPSKVKKRMGLQKKRIR